MLPSVKHVSHLLSIRSSDGVIAEGTIDRWEHTMLQVSVITWHCRRPFLPLSKSNFALKFDTKVYKSLVIALLHSNLSVNRVTMAYSQE
jgi:hypothetical protein